MLEIGFNCSKADVLRCETGFFENNSSFKHRSRIFIGLLHSALYCVTQKLEEILSVKTTANHRSNGAFRQALMSSKLGPPRLVYLTRESSGNGHSVFDSPCHQSNASGIWRLSLFTKKSISQPETRCPSFVRTLQSYRSTPTLTSPEKLNGYFPLCIEIMPIGPTFSV